jgi:hypothetical protein
LYGSGIKQALKQGQVVNTARASKGSVSMLPAVQIAGDHSVPVEVLLPGGGVASAGGLIQSPTPKFRLSYVEHTAGYWNRRSSRIAKQKQDYDYIPSIRGKKYHSCSPFVEDWEISSSYWDDDDGAGKGGW